MVCGLGLLVEVRCYVYGFCAAVVLLPVKLFSLLTSILARSRLFEEDLAFGTWAGNADCGLVALGFRDTKSGYRGLISFSCASISLSPPDF